MDHYGDHLQNFITSTLLKKSRNLEKHKVDINLLGVIKRVTQNCNKYEGVTKELTLFGKNQELLASNNLLQMTVLSCYWYYKTGRILDSTVGINVNTMDRAIDQTNTD
jgi:hypothetical protein